MKHDNQMMLRFRGLAVYGASDQPSNADGDSRELTFLLGNTSGVNSQAHSDDTIPVPERERFLPQPRRRGRERMAFRPSDRPSNAGSGKKIHVPQLVQLVHPHYLPKHLKPAKTPIKPPECQF